MYLFNDTFLIEKIVLNFGEFYVKYFFKYFFMFVGEKGVKLRREKKVFST